MNGAHRTHPLPPRRDAPALRAGTLAVGGFGDQHEHEAEHIAEQVAHGHSVAAPQQAARPAASALAAPPGVQAALASPGRPLEPGLRKDMEQRFGHDFSRVRIHADQAAQRSAQALAAKAYTVGEQLVFGAGLYAPSTGAGRRLLAHELAHVVQQQGTAAIVQRDDNAAARKKQEAERARARKRLEDWAQTKNPKPSTDPTHKDFAFTAQDLAHDITHANQANLLDKPKDPAQLKTWQTAFRDAYQLALMILDTSGTDQREIRAALIASDLASAGFVTEAMDVANRLPDKQKEEIYETVVQSPEAASADQLRTVSAWFAGSKASPGDHPMLSSLTDRSGDFAKRLGQAKLLAVLAPTLKAYRKEADYLEDLAEILVFHKAGRVAVSEWLWKEDKDFLFEILETDYFGEPGYAVNQFTDASGTPRELTMAADMPWVYTYKQKYYTQHLVALGAKHQIQIDKPADLRFATLRTWLNAQTEHIGAALAAEHPNAPDKITAAYAQIADIFFFHVDRGDVTPNLAGQLGHLGPADPSGMRLKSDCDVLATYATRLLRSAGFTPVGYLALIPATGDGHAVALLKKADPAPPPEPDKPAQPAPERYHIVNNKKVTPSAAPTKEAAIKAALADALRIYNSAPEAYKVYYEDAAANGAMTSDLWTTKERVRRNDLGKTVPAPQESP